MRGCDGGGGLELEGAMLLEVGVRVSMRVEVEVG